MIYRREELGRATSERDVREFLYRAGMADAEDVDLTDEALFRAPDPSPGPEP